MMARPQLACSNDSTWKFAVKLCQGNHHFQGVLRNLEAGKTALEMLNGYMQNTDICITKQECDGKGSDKVTVPTPCLSSVLDAPDAPHLLTTFENIIDVTQLKSGTAEGTENFKRLEADLDREHQLLQVFILEVLKHMSVNSLQDQLAEFMVETKLDTFKSFVQKHSCS